MQVLRVDSEHPLWQSLVNHLSSTGDKRWVLTENGLPANENLVFLGGLIDDQIVGNLTLKKQPIIIPASEWAGDRDLQLRDTEGEPVYEMFVQTFSVEEAYQRKGIGRSLQEEGLRQTKLLDCYQMRSWSSLDKSSNYQLKLGLGFGFHPAIFETDSGLKVSGGYFIRGV